MSEVDNMQAERKSILKNYEEAVSELERYKSAFNNLHSFVAGLSLEPHSKYCQTMLPLNFREPPERCATCEAKGLYQLYAYIVLEQMRRVNSWKDLPQKASR